MGKGILVVKPNKDLESTTTSGKMEHSDLVAEMSTIENLPTQERLHLARMRRAQQLKVARQKEKEWAKLQRNQKHLQMQLNQRHNIKRHITFENSVVLLEAASRNDNQEVGHLLQRGITPDASNEDGLTALHQCCIDNNVEMLKLLLDYGANVDAQDSDKWTPLHAAATCGHLNLVRILINRGANLLAVNTDGNMPYDLCDDEETLDYIEAEMSKRGVTQELIDETRALTEKQMLNDLIEISDRGGDLDEPDIQGATPLHIAAANGYTKVVEFLLEHHVNVDANDKDLWSPVHAAACWGHLEVLEMLSQCGADLYTKNKDDETPSDICEDPEIRERIELLKTEQESKRLAEQQRRRVRRSQSNNTRAQSVRRTSLRDKTLTTKKDAVEETRLRLQAQEVFITPDSTTEPKSNDSQPSSAITTNTSLPSLPNNNSDIRNSNKRKSSSSSIGGISAGRSEVTTTLAGNDATDGHYNDDGSNGSNGSRNNNFRGNFKINSNNKTNSNPIGNINNFNNNNNNNNGALINGSINNGGNSTTTSSSYYHSNSYSNNQVDRRPPEGKDNEEFPLRDSLLRAGANSVGNLHKLGGSGGSGIGTGQQQTTNTDNNRSQTEIFQASKENGKINVQVTVLVDNALSQNPSGGVGGTNTLPTASSTGNLNSATTLANLKKQRSLSRTNVVLNENGSIISGSSPNATPRNSVGSAAAPPPLSISAQPLLNGSAYDYSSALLPTTQSPTTSSSLQSPLQSPQSFVTKFSGVTGDVVSDSTSSKKCCILM